MNSSIPAGTNLPPRASSGGTWVLSLTGICFLFGMLLAMQIRAQQKVSARRDSDRSTPMLAQNEILSLRKRLARESAGRAAMQAKLNKVQQDLALAATGSLSQKTKLQAQMQDLQMLAGLTPVRGSGVVVTMTDHPKAAKGGGSDGFLYGIVHDFDILQVVNELRAAGAEAIAVQGAGGEPIRVTGFSPIRCVGPVIYVDGEGVAPPFRVEAVGNADRMAAALRMPDGIVDKFSVLFPIKVREADDLKLPASESAPKMRVAKAN